jgi:hypothetical protein
LFSHNPHRTLERLCLIEGHSLKVTKVTAGGREGLEWKKGAAEAAPLGVVNGG